MAHALTAFLGPSWPGSWPAWVAAAGAMLFILTKLGSGAPTVFQFQNATIDGLKTKSAAQDVKIKELETKVAELEAVIANTRDLTPVLESLKAVIETLKTVTETLASNTTALQGLAMQIHAQGLSAPPPPVAPG